MMILDETASQRFAALIREHSGLVFGEATRADLVRVLVQLAAEKGIQNADELWAQLVDGSRGHLLLMELIARLTIGETHFFRNRPQMSALQTQILPELIERRRAARRLRFWSAGCASGEEPYTLAILLSQMIPDLVNWDVLILATDINPYALVKARRGLYSAWSFREVPDGIQHQYFRIVGNEFEILPEIRRLVTFAQLNLAGNAYPGIATNTYDMDIILCRNVLIYFDAATGREVAGRLYGALAPDGWLVVGHAEASMSTFQQYAAQTYPDTVIYRRRSEAVRAPAAQPEPVAGPRAPLVEVRPMPQRSTRPRSVLASRSPSHPGNGTPARSGQTVRQRPLAPVDQLSRVSELPAELEEALAMPVDSQRAFRIAKVYADGRNLEAARTWVRRALAHAPLLAPAHYLDGLISHELGERDAALGSLRRCIYADPSFALGYIALARLCMAEGQAARARAALRQLSALLAGQDPTAPIPEGDGLMVSQLQMQLQAIERELGLQRNS